MILKNKVKSVIFEPGNLVSVLLNIDGKPLFSKGYDPFSAAANNTRR